MLDYLRVTLSKFLGKTGPDQGFSLSFIHFSRFGNNVVESPEKPGQGLTQAGPV